jgi:putative cardiolipin synthase
VLTRPSSAPLAWFRRAVALAALVLGGAGALAQAPGPMAIVDAQVAAHPGKTGVYVLDAPVEALLARAWLADRAERSIEVQYFIWSTDNIGILAAEALLRAADRGVRVRVIVDDLMIDAPDKSLLALARHPNIDIRIYNPLTSVGVPLTKRVLNVVTNFRGVNQRMHDKTLVVDGKVAITGGRNMAAEYFDYNRRYNFRDRDVLLLGTAVAAVQANFDRFWGHPLSVPVESLYDGLGLMKKSVQVSDAEIQQIYRDLHAYAKSPENFAPEVRVAIEATPTSFPRVAREMVWSEVEFISDQPGKNSVTSGLGGGGESSAALARLVAGAQRRVVIQSPYLVFSDAAWALFRGVRERGVEVRINTNSLAATDNLPAFSGYRNQREQMLALGLRVFEYRPDAQVQRRQMEQRIPALQGLAPVFSLHAKTVVIDSEVVVIGTFNLDPRSENLNTEVGAVIRDASVARAVEALIEADMAAGSSWDAARDDPDQYADRPKRAQVRVLQVLPLRPLL